MRATRMLWQHRQPMIRFLGKRTAPPKVDHTPHVHPASPSDSLPDSFASYRSKAQQHGPLGGKNNDTSSAQSSSNNNPLTPPPSSAAGAQTSEPYGSIGGRSGKDLGSVQPKQGEFWDRNELPARFRRKGIAMAEIEAVESGGATMMDKKDLGDEGKGAEVEAQVQAKTRYAGPKEFLKTALAL